MCGSSQNQNTINNAQIQAMNQQTSFLSTLTQQYQQDFSQNQQILQSLTSSLQPIISGGPSQQGYSPQEIATLNAQAAESTAAGYRSAATSTGEESAARGGGNSFIPSAAQSQINAQLASSATNQETNLQTGILQSGYELGNKNYEAAIGQLAGVPGALEGATAGAASSVNSGANALTSSSNAAASEANAITEANNSWMGLVGGIASTALGGYTSSLGRSKSAAPNGSQPAVYS